MYYNKDYKHDYIPSMVVALFVPGRICNIWEVEKTLSSGPVNCLAPALRFLLLQLCKGLKYDLIIFPCHEWLVFN